MAILYGVGVGSGDPELMTLKAVRVIQECEVIVVPSQDIMKSVAYNIAVKAVPEIDKKELMGIHMPMSKDENSLKNAHAGAANMIMEQLAKGKNVAFLTLGDPTIFSTYTYIQEMVESHGYKTQIINGIASFLAAASHLNKKLVVRDETLHIISSTYGISEAIALSGTKVFMKAGKKMSDIKKMLAGTDKKAYFIENCGMENEIIIEGIDDMPDTAGYYSMIIVSDK